MFTKTLSPKTERALSLLSDKKILQKAYLAGGTGLALQLGHRFSVDLDFFTSEKNFSDQILKTLKAIGNFSPRLSIEDTLLGTFDGVDFSLFHYPYILIRKLVVFNNLRVASIEDIAAMKIAAIADRGRKRDFVDLYALMQNYSLGEIFNFYDEKYKKLEINLYHILKSLTYFNDSEDEEMPELFIKAIWPEIKEFIKEKVKKEAGKYF